MKRLSILGSTGSIGRQCLQVVESLPGRFVVVGLAAGANVEVLAEQVKLHRPDVVSVSSEKGVQELAERLRSMGIDPLPEIQHGTPGMEAVATHPDAEMVLSAAVGVVGLPATYEAVKLGKQIALANKEVLVAAGELVTAAAREHKVELLPVDSEHNAIHQCLRGGERREVKRLILTASGGPFRKTPLAEMEKVTPEQALAHPNWVMGNRITIDSATMMNKGFEVIEAHWLFGVSREQIDVVLHPQSTVHSMVEFVDGSIIAQLGLTDMRVPIQYALTYPERVASNGWRFDLGAMKRLDFGKVSTRRYPCLRLAREALRKGGALPCALNAADEVAVAAFLERKLNFPGIAGVVEDVLEKMPRARMTSMDEVLAADSEARRLAREAVSRRIVSATATNG
jgi:1-deoxy-D-xylulose-5-phosphate reductoisomerase